MTAHPPRRPKHAQIDPDVLAALTPTGKLRAGVNLGNPILANRGPDGNPSGISIDLARELAKRLGVEVELVVFDAAGKSVEAVAAGNADVGFFALDPLRGAAIAFTAPYVLIEGAYLVRVHHLMPHTEASLPSASRAGVAAARDGPFTCGFLATRVERPKWLAA